MNFRPILHVLGILIFTLGLAMAFPMLADIIAGSSDWLVFFLCMLGALFTGGLLVITTSGDAFSMNTRQGFMMISSSWIILCAFSSLPFYFAGLDLSFTDSVFEAVSGLTTTGATVLIGLEELPPGILLWRAILQWLGGIGIILMAMSVMPFLNIGGMQLFQTELSENEKALPRIADLAKYIGALYAVFTVMCLFGYLLSGFTPFDALAHAMTTIATGGYSTFDASFQNFTTPWPYLNAILFMIIGGIPFLLFLKVVRGRAGPLLKDQQVRGFLLIAFSVILFISLYRIATGAGDDTLFWTILHTAFNVVSIMTGTGYASADYGLWGPFAVMAFFFLMVIGACAGSTSCGIKVFRFQILVSLVLTHLKRLIYPHAVYVPRYNGQPVRRTVQAAVLAFFFLFALCFAVIAGLLTLTGLDFITSLSGAATALANVGPGLGSTIGPTGTFAPISDAAKWILSVAMIMGRLEIFPIMILFAPRFWEK